MRIQKGFDQYSASKLCKFSIKMIGFMENGRVSMTEKKLGQIVESYGFTMEYFYQLLKLPLLRHQMVEGGQSIMAKLGLLPPQAISRK